MEEKMQSAIKSITLDGCTYHNITITPTLINFFYGKNGVGKSTIAQQIRNNTDLHRFRPNMMSLCMIENL